MLEVLLIIFLLGLGVGSFLNVLIDRLPREESFIKGRSYCESCKTTLKWYDLIPLLSFITLIAKCRYCRSPLSFYYPTVEFVTGIMFAITTFFVLNNFQSNLNFQLHQTLPLFYYLFIVSSLVVVFFVDLKYGIIPDAVILLGAVVSLAYLFIIHNSLFLIYFLSGIGAFIFFVLIFLLTRGRGMGFGDVKFVFLMGLILGFPKIIVGMYAAFLTGAVVSIILILAKKKKFKGSTIAFGPFLVLGTLIALFWGEVILQKAFPFL